jgi:hypothetical protein
MAHSSTAARILRGEYQTVSEISLGEALEIGVFGSIVEEEVAEFGVHLLQQSRLSLVQEFVDNSGVLPLAHGFGFDLGEHIGVYVDSDVCTHEDCHCLACRSSSLNLWAYYTFETTRTDLNGTITWEHDIANIKLHFTRDPDIVAPIELDSARRLLGYFLFSTKYVGDAHTSLLDDHRLLVQPQTSVGEINVGVQTSLAYTDFLRGSVRTL